VKKKENHEKSNNLSGLTRTKKKNPQKHKNHKVKAE